MRAAKVTVKVVEEPDAKSSLETTVVPRSDYFVKFAARSARYLGSRWAFLTAIGVILVWALTDLIFRYSDTWRLVINTDTTIVTFLMVFLINTQNRNARAIHLKLNELIHAVDKAKIRMIDVENLYDLDLDELARTYEKLRISAEQRHHTSEKLAPR